jgi:beta-hydroxylase
MVILICILFLVCIVLYVLLLRSNPYNIISWWNTKISKQCEIQDNNPKSHIKSYFDADDCPNKTVTALNQLITLNHDQILKEVEDTLETYHGNPMNEFDITQKEWLKDENRWRPIWIKFIHGFAGTADKIPTLKKITAMFPDISLLHVSLFFPGTELSLHYGVSSSVHRYHYGLKIPDGNVALNLNGNLIKWKDRHGFIWNDMIPHSAWNKTDQVRIIIFADIFRELSPIQNIISRLIYKIVSYTDYFGKIRKNLDNKDSTKKLM